MVPMHANKRMGLSMSVAWFGVSPSGGSKALDRLKPGLQTDAAEDFLLLILLLIED